MSPPFSRRMHSLLLALLSLRLAEGWSAWPQIPQTVRARPPPPHLSPTSHPDVHLAAVIPTRSNFVAPPIPLKHASSNRMPRTELYAPASCFLLFALITRRWGALLYSSYESAAIAWPILTKAGTSALAYTAGDLLSQKFSSSKATSQPIDSRRTIRSMLAGGISHGPQLHFWCLLLEHVVGPGRVALKIVLDQTFFALYLNAAYAALTETLKGSSPEAIFTRVKQSSWPSLRASWRFWPA
ncbi:MAG: hypothetical protein SGPRY_014488, partial [Prymnesium sp.]